MYSQMPVILIFFWVESESHRVKDTSHTRSSGSACHDAQIIVIKIKNYHILVELEY